MGAQCVGSCWPGTWLFGTDQVAARNQHGKCQRCELGQATAGACLTACLAQLVTACRGSPMLPVVLIGGGVHGGRCHTQPHHHLPHGGGRRAWQPETSPRLHTVCTPRYNGVTPRYTSSRSPGARLPAVLTSERGAQEWRHALHNKASTAAGVGSQRLTAVLRGHGYAQRLRMQAQAATSATPSMLIRSAAAPGKP